MRGIPYDAGMRTAAVRPGEWAALWTATGLAMVVVLAAAAMPAICPADGSCTQGARIVPAVLGVTLILGTAVATGVLAWRHAGHVREGVRRSESIVAVGAAVMVVLSVGSAAITLVSAGFVALL